MKHDPTIKFANRHVTVSMTVREWTDVILSLAICATDDDISDERRKALTDEANHIAARVAILKNTLFDDIGEPGTPEYRQGGFTKA